MPTIKRQAQMYLYHETARKGFPKAVTQLCFDCGKQAKHWDHYKGYEKQNWLEVQAVCVSCHFLRENKRDASRIRKQADPKIKTCIHGITPTTSCRDCINTYCRKWRNKNIEFDRTRCLNNYYKRKLAKSKGY